MDELTPDELEEAVVQEAEQVERERNKRRLLVLLGSIPADSPLWERLADILLAEAIPDWREGV